MGGARRRLSRKVRAGRRAAAPAQGACPPEGASGRLPGGCARWREAVREFRIRAGRRNSARSHRAEFLRSALSTADAGTRGKAYDPFIRFTEEGSDACRPS